MRTTDNEARIASFEARASKRIVADLDLIHRTRSVHTFDVLGISGSPSRNSRSTWVLRWLLGRTAASADNQLIQLRDLPASALLGGDADEAEIAGALERVRAARVLVLATPIYKAAYSGMLKVFLDLLPQDSLRGKTVLRVATGGGLAHQLALDYALAPVLAALGARGFSESLFITDPQLPAHAVRGFEPTGELLARLERFAQFLAVEPAGADPSTKHVSQRPSGALHLPARSTGLATEAGILFSSIGG